MKSILVYFFLLSFSATLAAQTAAPATAPSGSTTLDEAIVVTASALPETVESTPAAVTVITREQIDQQQARDVVDVLREVPGVIVARSGTAGHATSMFTRGAASTQTLVMWNGIEINNPYFSGYDWGRFSTAGVDRIEVVRGPFSALYGSDAMAGVVNVLTTPRASGFHFDLERGGNGLRNGEVDGAWSSATAQLSAAYEHREDDGFDPNDDFRQNTASAFAKWMPSQSWSLGVAARHTSYDLGIPFNTNALGTALVPSLERRQSGHETQFSIPLGFNFAGLANELSYAESRRTDDFNDPDDPFITGSTTRSKTRHARLTSRVTTGIGTLVFGGEYERAVVDDVTNFGPNFTNGRQQSRSLFFEDRISQQLGSARLEVSVGARYDRYDSFGSQTSPRIAAAFITGNEKFRVAYGHGFRAPSLGELYYPFFGNANLNAERSRSYEAGWDHAVGREGLFSATYFNSRYRQLITFDPVTFISQNLGRVKTDGVELGYQQRAAGNVFTSLSYTYLAHAEDQTTGERLLRRPKHAGSASIGWRSGALESNVTAIRSGEREDTLPVFPFSRALNRSYTTYDAALQLHLGRLIPYVKVENATDKQYEEVLGFRSPGRRVSVGVRYGM